MDGDACAIHSDAVVIGGEFGMPAPVHGVEFQQMGVHLWVADGIVEPSDTGATFKQWFECQFSYSAEPVNGVDSHV